jgi:hypothetical protein
MAVYGAAVEEELKMEDIVFPVEDLKNGLSL